MIPAPNHRWLRFSLRTLFVAVTILCIAASVVFNSPRRQYRRIQIGMSLPEVESILGESGASVAALTFDDVEFVEDPKTLLKTAPHRGVYWNRGSHQIGILLGRDGLVAAKYNKRSPDASAFSRQLDSLGI